MKAAEYGEHARANNAAITRTTLIQMSLSVLKKVRGTVTPSVSRNITLLRELLRNTDDEVHEVNRHVNFLKTKEAELRQMDKAILDVNEDDAMDKELKSAADYNAIILFAIADAKSFLSQRQESIYLN
ncbi:hypothetical protein HPB50_004252 [Hyalomma asiaticum]|uniref:Uncharacterized protein n=1 Tax=Hyalomma asiaticum TaxID=266040 RepID=A0ACB7TBV3_HYAAI|nr:hypothetical protein HPB50_004252 [Hyalomma asiaticum]